MFHCSDIFSNLLVTVNEKYVSLKTFPLVKFNYNSKEFHNYN